jgi:hypothetical protein
MLHALSRVTLHGHPPPVSSDTPKTNRRQVLPSYHPQITQLYSLQVLLATGWLLTTYRLVRGRLHICKKFVRVLPADNPSRRLHATDSTYTVVVRATNAMDAHEYSSCSRTSNATKAFAKQPRPVLHSRPLVQRSSISPAHVARATRGRTRSNVT